MCNKKYYAERNKKASREKYDLTMLKRLFNNLYRRLDEDCFFQESFGYYCTDGDVIGKLGVDIGAAIFFKTGLRDAWTIYEKLDTYTDFELFTMIEFLFDNVSEPTDKYYHSWNQCGYHATKFDKLNGQKIFVSEVNSLLEGYEVDLILNDEGEVRTRTTSELEHLINEDIETDDVNDVDKRIKYSISTFLHFNSDLEQKKDAVRTLGDVLEYYKKQEIILDQKDDSALFQIINKFDIRHHNKEQQGAYNKEVWYEWMFYTFLSSIRLLQKLHNKQIVN